MTHTSVRKTQQIIDAREFQEWQEYYKLEPFGDDWLQAGTIAATAVNSNPFVKRSVKPERFIPKAKASKTPAEIEAQMNAWARAHNARIQRN